MARRYWYIHVLPGTAMVAVERSNVAIKILFKAASTKGLSYYISLAYSFGLATFVLLPVTFFSIRFSGEICVYKGLELGSPTFSSTISNLVPAFTFMLAVFFSVIGSLISSAGLYAVLWGKAKEEEEEKERTDDDGSCLSSSSKVPLL